MRASSDFLTHVQDPQAVVQWVFFFYLDWPSGAVRVHSRAGTLSWGGHDWAGAGGVGFLGQATSGDDREAARLTLGIAAPLDALLVHAAADTRRRRGTLWAGGLDAAGAVIPDPMLEWDGFVDGKVLTIDPVDENGFALARLELTLSDGAYPRAPVRRVHTFEEHRARYAGDTAFQHTARQWTRTFNLPSG